jgi:hypothetical protein
MDSSVATRELAWAAGWRLRSTANDAGADRCCLASRKATEEARGVLRSSASRSTVKDGGPVQIEQLQFRRNAVGLASLRTNLTGGEQPVMLSMFWGVDSASQQPQFGADF